jgi:ribosome-binding protein aMBF1 (putative translation factor)
MAKTNFDQYVEKRGKVGSAESRAARKVFTHASVFASALMQARKASGMTQSALAEKSGVQQADISRMENGSMIPTLNTFMNLMDALGVTVTLKIGDKPTRKNSGRLMIEVVA